MTFHARGHGVECRTPACLTLGDRHRPVVLSVTRSVSQRMDSGRPARALLLVLAGAAWAWPTGPEVNVLPRLSGVDFRGYVEARNVW